MDPNRLKLITKRYYLRCDGNTEDEPKKLLQTVLANREHFAAVFNAANAIILVFTRFSRLPQRWAPK